MQVIKHRVAVCFSGLMLGLLVGAMLLLALLPLAGCGQKDIGGAFSNDKAGRAQITNPSPVTLQIEDADKKGIANGPGPARFTSITADQVQTFQSGTTPRDMFLQLPDGTKLNLSSGTDIAVKGLDFNPKTGSIKVAEFGTNSSEPLRAGNEAYDRLVAYWNSRDEASKQAILAELQTVEAVAPVAAGVVGELIKILAGQP